MQDQRGRAVGDGRPTGAPVVQAIGITKRFGATIALNDVGLTVLPGESHALVGRNGAGKSTLVSILTGLAKPDAGQVLFGGEPAPSVADPNGWRAHVACVYQKSTIIQSLSVAENLYLNRQDAVGGRPVRVAARRQTPPSRTGRWRGLISWRSLYAHAAQLLANWNLDVDP